MNVATLPRTVLRAEYTALRLPSRLIEQRLLARLPASDPRRLGVERALGKVDALAGRVLGDDVLAQRGATLQAHADTAAKAAQLESEAEQRREQAAATLGAEREAAAKERTEAAKEHREEVTAAKRDEQAEKAKAEEQARARAKAEKDAVDRQAKAKIDAADAKRKTKVTSIERRTDVATAAPKAALAEARDDAKAAAAKRDDAKTLESLAAREREQRRSG